MVDRRTTKYSSMKNRESKREPRLSNNAASAHGVSEHRFRAEYAHMEKFCKSGCHMALFCYFKREKGNLPDPNGPLARSVPSTSIAAAEYCYRYCVT